MFGEKIDFIVCIYIRSDLAFNELDELSNEELEATWIEILLPKTKPIVCGVVYRPPHNFYELYESVCLTSSYLIDRVCYVLRDFNTDVSSNQ